MDINQTLSDDGPLAEVTARNLRRSRLIMLPTEVRFNIYSRCLVSSSPIVVWSAQLRDITRDMTRHFKVPMYRPNREGRATDIRAVFISLLHCSRSTAADAAFIFYRKNTFCFSGDHEYYRILFWLDQIGHQNRDNISGLEISVDAPPKAWQLPDGTRLKRENQGYNRLRASSPHFSPRHPHLVGPSHNNPEGEVDVINPAIEAIISLFARPHGVPKTKLILNLMYASVPGAMDWGVFPFRHKYFTMDLPNLVEKWRTDYTFGAMEVFWRGEAIRKNFLDQQTVIADLGWEVFDEEEMERPWLGPYFFFWRT
ncbi:MAG: hypothetical protein Q9221_006585 [Calogaya cf. arnoldii]